MVVHNRRTTIERRAVHNDVGVSWIVVTTAFHWDGDADEIVIRQQPGSRIGEEGTALWDT